MEASDPPGRAAQTWLLDAMFVPSCTTPGYPQDYLHKLRWVPAIVFWVKIIFKNIQDLQQISLLFENEERPLLTQYITLITVNYTIRAAVLMEMNNYYRCIYWKHPSAHFHLYFLCVFVVCFSIQAFFLLWLYCHLLLLKSTVFHTTVCL